ncbi:MAG: hypothetical protein ACYDA5_11820 [Vulcanimicrobiaceae bacterium]
MALVCSADLGISAPRVMRGVERERALGSRRRTTVAELCAQAGVRYRVSGGRPPRVVLWNRPSGYTISETGEKIYAVDCAALPQQHPQRALRILEILAYGFQDYFARESVCGRGYFVYPVTPEHGRAWLADIGRRGGKARSVAKAQASRRNGRTPSATKRTVC